MCGFLQEKDNKEKLLKKGFSEKIIKEYQKKHCLGCGNLRKYCQCPFSGSAHPNEEERLALVEIELIKELYERIEKAEITLFVTVKNRILEQQFEGVIGRTDVDVLTVRTIQKMQEVIDFKTAGKTRILAEIKLKELKERK